MPQQEESYSLDAMLEAANIERLDEADRIYSHEVREIISSKPVWIVRNGIAMFFVIIGLLFTLTFFIQYPDIVKAPVKIVGDNLPKQIISKSEGRIVYLNALENKKVIAGDVLAILQSNADYKQVLLFKKWIDQTELDLKGNNWNSINQLGTLNQLGDLQKNYQDIAQQIYQLSWAKTKGYFNQKRDAIAQDIRLINLSKENANNQKQLILQDLAMQQGLLAINEKLANEKVIAPLDLIKDKSTILSKKQQLVQVDAADIQLNFIAALFNAKSSLTEWTNRYILVASETGTLQFASYFQENSWIKTGQELFYIIPKQPTYFAELIASQQNFGKLKQGQQVNIALNSYQRNEFGVLKGTIINIPQVPYKDTSFLIKVKLNNGLQTNYQKTIHFSNSLTGTADIITAEASLADRLLYQWRGLFAR
ncbi:HlyD family efflux transporter periplasmic adaptor subunit [Sediminibacterium salmoneum]|uniref:HlyD family efflux transporter periplasmic adaptor subunit n=1 Tax=Sediminibacterium salmoneum TaxID=426421 RepID=UPI00047EF8A4|nr:HlyD family efflux transporter periplasmic adaptor subunit [Sediminibacterium salmoneum]